MVKQDSPADDDTSIYHIFERLNSGGRKLTAQEIRTAVFHGMFIDLIKDLNNYPNWRKIFGKTNERMRDQELILRFFAIYEESQYYKKPMTEFLTKYLKKNRNLKGDKIRFLSELFTSVIDAFNSAIDHKLFRISKAINVAFFEAAMFGLANRMVEKGKIEKEKIKQAYSKLLQNGDFINSVSQSTTNTQNVATRLRISKDVFMRV